LRKSEFVSLVGACLVSSVVLVCPARADALTLPRGPQIEGIDLLVLVGGGFGYPSEGGVFASARLRRLPEVPLALEANIFFGSGIGFNVLFDVYRNDWLRVHILDVGLFRSWTAKTRLTEPEVNRDYDITFGAGVEWQFAPSWWMTADFRFFMPDPFRVIGYYGDFARLIYRNCAAGVQTWIGIGHSF